MSALGKRAQAPRTAPVLRLCTLLCLFFLALHVHAQLATASLHVHIARQQGKAASAQKSSAGVVVWLTPLQASTTPQPRRSQPFVLTQKDKQFSPHMLVVPTGASVEFPNLDPFFHNVFSLFNGKRFDLGLYEAHTRRSVQFDREGVSYIFCNIHPEMGAVIISLSTPYYAVSSPDGSVAIHGLPPGKYRMQLWAEEVPIEQLAALTRSVDITKQDTDLGTFSIVMTGNLMKHHENKFGESYPPERKTPYQY